MLFRGRGKILSAVVKSLPNKERVISRVKAALRERLRGETSLCGTLVQYQKQGILIMGDSGTGKSSCALALVLLGGRLISDDVVVLRKMPAGTLSGRSPGRTKDRMAVRDLGIVHVRHLLGDWAVANESPVGMVVSLAGRRETDERGFAVFIRILGVRLPLLRLERGSPYEAAETIRSRLSSLRPCGPPVR